MAATQFAASFDGEQENMYQRDETTELTVRNHRADLLVEMQDICKSFGGVRALNNITFSIHRGEILALVGDNGAGKSTLIKVLAGALIRDHGDMIIEGEMVKTHTPRSAREQGIETVYQDLALFDQLDVTTNFYFGREITTKLGLLDKREMSRNVKLFLEEFGIVIKSVSQRVGTLSGGQRHSIAIGRAVYVNRNPKLIILDEPTAGLGVEQSRNVLQLIRELKKRKLAVILISHNMDHVLAVSERILVLRSGKLVAEKRTEATNVESLLQAMLGKGNEDAK